LGQSNADPETLQSIRSELTQLYAEVQALRAEMAGDGGATATAQLNGPAVVRLDAMEQQLREVTGQVEQLRFRMDQIVVDGTRRIGDLEFRLVELEGGDLSALGETPTLGGEAVEMASVIPAPSDDSLEDGVELAVSEEADFDAATQSLGDGDYANAVIQFGQFLSNYPGGPLSARALFHMGEAQEAMGQHKDAARSYLDSFTTRPDGSYAPQALMRVAISLGELGKVDNACQTLNEVLVRYPNSAVIEQTRSSQQSLGCS
jgi:tol-pal system protein YbgF